MANRIDKLDGGSVSSGTGGAIESILPAKPVGAAATGSSGPSAASTDSVHITASGRALAALAQAVNDTPEVDASRVGHLQQAIASGSYGIDPEQIAGRMLQLEQDLGGTGK